MAVVAAVLASDGVVAILSTAEKIKHPNTPLRVMSARGAPRASPARRYREKALDSEALR
jgi:hypothetical protein